MNPKPQPNHREYILALRRMTPEQRLNQAFELSEIEKQAELRELSRQFPDLDKKSVTWIYLQRLVNRDKQELERIFNATN